LPSICFWIENPNAIFQAKHALRALVGSQPVRREGGTFDQYKRLIVVRYAGTINLNAEMALQGWALAYRRYSKDSIPAEMEAREARRGIWAGGFEAPWKAAA